MVSGAAVNYKGEYLSFLEVQCPIPETTVMKGDSTLSNLIFKTLVSRFFRHDSKTHGIHFPLTGLNAQGFKISVTSDGHRYSQEALFIVADGYCTKCTAAGVCTDNVSTNYILL